MRRRAYVLALWFVGAAAGCGLFDEDDAVRPVVPTVQVLSFAPQGAVPSTQNLRVQFSEAVVPAERVGQVQPADDVLVVSPDLLGEGRWVAPDTFELEPGRTLAANTRYMVRIRERTVGPTRRLVGARRFSFHTALFRVISADAQRSEEGLQAVVELSHGVRADDAVGAITFRDADGRVLPARLLGEGVQHILRFVLPSTGFDAEEGVRLRVEPTLVPECGGVALEKPVTVLLSFEPPSTVEARGAALVWDASGSELRVRLNVDVDPTQAKSFVSLDPPTPVELGPAYRGLMVKGAFTPGILHRVLLREGMPTAAGRLDRDLELEFQVPNQAPSLRFEPEGLFLVADSDVLTIEAVNVGRLKVKALRIPDRNIAHVDLSMERESSSLGTVVSEIDLEASQRQDQTQKIDLSLQALLRGGPGLYRIDVEDTEHAWVRTRGWLVQHGLLVTAKSGVDYVRARVAGHREAGPVAGAQVSGYSRTGRRLFEVRTDAKGIAEFRGPLDPEDPVTWLVAHRDRRSAYLPMNQTRLPLYSGPPSAQAPAFLWTVQDYVKAGEALPVFALAEPGSLSGGRWELSGPEGPVGEALPSLESGRGFARVDFLLDPQTVPGPYVVHLTQANGTLLGAVSVRVVDPEPPALQVVLTPPAQPVPGAPLPFSVRAISRFGGRTAGLKVEGRCRYRPIPVVAKGAPGFTFGPLTFDPGVEVEAMGGTLDAEGAATVSCPAPSPATPPGHRVQVDLRVTVYEPGGKPASASQRIVADTVAHYVGLRHRAGVLQGLVIEPDGQAVSAVALQAAVFPGAWRGEGDEGGQSAVARLSAVSEGQPVVLPFDPPRAGAYRAEVGSGSGSGASLDFWVLTGSTATALPHVEVTAPEAPVVVGGRATVQLRLPFVGRVRITVERGRVLYAQSYEGAGRTMDIELPVLPEFAPNALLVVQLEGAQGRAYGSAPLLVDDTERRLEVKVELPNGAQTERFPVVISVQGAHGPTQAVLTVVPAERWGASGRELRDPAAHFAALRAVEVSTHDPMVLGRAWPERPTVRLEGADPVAPAAPARVPASSQPFVSDLIKLSARGTGWTTGRTPSGGGAKVISVVAFDGHAMGVTHLTVPSGAGPKLRLRAPHALQTGDRVQVPLTIENPGAAALTVTSSAAVQGPLRLTASPRGQVEVPSGQARTVDLKVEATGPGSGALVVTVSGPNGLVEAFAPLLVHPPVAQEVWGAVTQARHSQPGHLALDAALDPVGAWARVSVGPGQVNRYLAAFDALYFAPVESPSLAALRGLAVLAVPELVDPSPPVQMMPARARLSADLKGLGASLDSEGQVLMWSRGPVAGVRVDLQAGLLFAEARRAGEGVDPAAWTRLVRRMETILQSEGPSEVRAMAAFVLARGMVRNFEVPDALLSDKGNAPTRALMAAALLGTGRVQAGRALLAGSFQPSPAVRDTAWTLLALATVVAAHPAVSPLKESLEQASKGGRWADQESNALALFALKRLDRIFSQAVPYWGTIVSGSQRVQRFNSTKTVLVQSEAEVWTSGLDVTVTGAGVAQVGLSLVGTPKDAQTAMEAGLQVSRRFLRPTGQADGSGAAELGALWVCEVQVQAAQPAAQGGAEVAIPVPAGFSVEQVWPAEIPGLELPRRGVLEEARTGLRWWVDLGPEPARIAFTMRATRPGRFSSAPVQAWHAAEPSIRGRSGALQWTVSSP